jgi:uncharacterized membrane protein YcaP (DUF421 family)
LEAARLLVNAQATPLFLAKERGNGIARTPLGRADKRSRPFLVFSGMRVLAGTLLRISGKRTPSKMNAFDLVLTVALGSTLATVLLSSNVALTEGLLAFALLNFLPFGVTWLSIRSSTFRRFVNNEPKLLFYDGGFLRGDMGAERVAEEEVEAAVRQQGLATSRK